MILSPLFPITVVPDRKPHFASTTPPGGAKRYQCERSIDDMICLMWL